MLTAVLLAMTVAHAAPDVHLAFRNAGDRACEIELTRATRGGADFFVSRLDVPGLPPGPPEVSDWLRTLGYGDANALDAVGAGNHADLGYLDLLNAAFDAGSPTLAKVRASWNEDDAHVARTAREFLSGTASGRVMLIEPVAPMADEPAVQGQAMLVALPDATYPRGVIIGAHGCAPTWTPVLNVRWDDEDRRDGAAMLTFVTVTEDAATRGTSYHFVVPAPGPSYVHDETTTLTFDDF